MNQLPIEKAKKGIPLTQAHKKKISEALKRKYGKDITYDQAFLNFIDEAKPTIKALAIKFAGKHSVEDLIHETITQMYEKFELYIPKLSNPKTFTNMCAKQIMFWMNRPDNLNNHQWVVLAKIKALQNEYAKRKVDLSSFEISKKLKIKHERIEAILIGAQTEKSLDDTTFEDLTLGDMLPAERDIYNDPETAFEQAQIKEMTDNALDSLTKEEYDVITMATGYHDGEALWDAEIARRLKTNPVQVKIIREKALKKLRNSPLMSLTKSYDNLSKIIIMYNKYIDDLSNRIELNNQQNTINDTLKSLISNIDKKIQDINKSKNYEDIRIRQRKPSIFDKKSLRTINLTKSIKATYGKLPNDSKLRVQTLIFNTNPNKCDGEAWNLKKAKEWVSLNKSNIKVSVDIKDLLQKCQNKIQTISK